MEADGAYVLGALSPAERLEFERHLAECADCAGAVRQLAPLPGLLGRVDPAMLDSTPAGPPLLPRLLAAAGTLRRRQVRVRRWRLALAAVATAVVAAAGTLAGVAVMGGPTTGGPAPGPIAAPMSPVANLVPVTAEVRLWDTTGGTAVWMRCRYPALGYNQPPRTFRLVAVSGDGSYEQVGSWRAGPGDQVELTGLTQLSGTDLVRVEVQSLDGAPLLTYEP